ncbi:SgcJ/EcaC family oxidoreductase [Streptomyces alboflavus]|uniref:SgcJ/EcaC family oxidoreductase n=1 Tax=Streptomyces alboflavus TaxID=67267 RepID=UPI0009969084|nr:SgcJ/EcaC family oxidoreductase [Streptomyces alboflavus]
MRQKRAAPTMPTGALCLTTAACLRARCEARILRTRVQRTGAETCGEVIPADADRCDGKAVCATLDALADAWERGDAEAYGRQFTEDGTYTTYIGSHYEGRADITASHRALFKGFLKDSKLAARYLDMRFLTKDVAVLTSCGADYTGDKPGADELSKVTTFAP